ncbi:hypothetical protein FDG66_gp50 [Streptomyces phage phiCAM]|uniref:Uncharacterized protein n=1 Tax=Streptomyces phage phiCAM TaxID=1239386 RepID=K4NZT0_9CAUD|nr:hypothetical protein FDG66_gp50 [Streptomyces phage phiCAM]AFV51370.1 hypothetical protein [Streptomyces phage phiCAM]
MTREELRQVAREELRQNPPPPLSDEQVVHLRQLLGIAEAAPSRRAA